MKLHPLDMVRLRHLAALALTLLLIVMFIPWLGDTLFNTKGEPREAIVAYSMLDSGNFILPQSYGGDIPYKPPFLAWLIVLASVLTGACDEMAARLPSAVATVALIVALYCFVERHTKSTVKGLLTALVTVTTVEVWRAATACRVDMVLTACMVGAMMAFFDHRACSPKKSLFSWWAVLLMTGAVLAKGPVGMVLPCLAVWVFALLAGDGWWRSGWRLAVCGALALVVPALWYWAAAEQGGERFVALAMEENFGRMTGTMSYASHENPFWYNFVTLAAGLLPYTLLVLMALWSVKGCRRLRYSPGWTRRMQPVTLFALAVVVTVFLFYCFPKSKRSVYLLPMYPFMGYFLTLLIMWLADRGKASLRWFAGVIAGVSLLACWLVWGLHMVDGVALIPGLKHTLRDLAQGLWNQPFGIVDWLLLIVAIGVAAWTLVTLRRRERPDLLVGGLMATVVSLYCVLGVTVLPCVLNPKSDMAVVKEINRQRLAWPVYTYNAAPLMRWYTVNFYSGDKLRLFAPEHDTSQSVDTTDAMLPVRGTLLVSKRDMEQWLKEYGSTYQIDTLWCNTRRSGDCRSEAMLLRFKASRPR